MPNSLLLRTVSVQTRSRGSKEVDTYIGSASAGAAAEARAMATTTEVRIFNRESDPLLW